MRRLIAAFAVQEPEFVEPSETTVGIVGIVGIVEFVEFADFLQADPSVLEIPVLRAGPERPMNPKRLALLPAERSQQQFP